MNRLYSPVFPCNGIKRDSLDTSLLNLDNQIELVPFSEGFGCFDGFGWYWIDEKEKERIKEKQFNVKEFNRVQPISVDGWYSYSPLELEIEITRLCNQRCLHCWNESEPQNQLELSLNKILGLISEFREKGGQRLLITGGEPLLYHDLERVLNKAKEAGIRKMELVTNGNLINKRVAKMLSKYLEYVNISIHGHGHDPETHDRITQEEGSFSMAMKGAQLLQGEGTKVVVYFTIMKDNFYSIPHMLELVKNNSFGAIRFNCVNYLGRGRNLEPVTEEGKMLLSSYIVEQARLLGVRIITSELSREEYLRNISSYKFYGCNALRTLIYICADGLAYPCSLVGKPVGDINKDSLTGIWTSKLVSEERKAKCSGIDKCCIGNNCGGKCKASNLKC